MNEFQEFMNSFVLEQMNLEREFLRTHPEAIPLDSEMEPDGEGGYRYVVNYLVLEDPKEREAFLELRERAKHDPFLKDILNDMIRRSREKQSREEKAN